MADTLPEGQVRKKVLVIIVLLLISPISISTSSIKSNNANLNLNYFNELDYTLGRFEGFNFYILENKNLANFEVLTRTLLISDMEGEIYFSRDVGTSDTLDTRPIEIINSNTIFYGLDSKSYLWDLETNTTIELNFWSHHDTEYNYVNNTFFTLKSYDIEYNERTYKFDYVNEYSPEGDIVWFLDTRSFINFSQWCPFGDASPPFDQYGGVRNIVHANTVFFDELEDALYLNCRNVNTFYKIDHATKKVLWGLGEYGNFTMFDIDGNEQDFLFFHAHSLEKIDEDKYILFDNDYHNQTDSSNQLSRLIEITIDENKMYANITREWVAPSDYYSISFGDCDLLPNNNLLGVFGTYTHPGSEYGAILTEVDINGDIQWELTYPNDGETSSEVFQIERLRFSPIVSETKFINEGDGTGYFEWEVWYNFRSKTQFIGHYYITIGNQTVEDGEIEFPLYWQSIKKRYYVEEIPEGNVDITLAVADEKGHLSNETEFFKSPEQPKLIRRGMIIGLTLGGISIVIVAVLVWFNFTQRNQLPCRRK
jgi:hypothetical protein